MPIRATTKFDLKPAGRASKYFVVEKGTERAFSQHALPRAQAIRQMRALYASAHKVAKKGGRMSIQKLAKLRKRVAAPKRAKRASRVGKVGRSLMHLNKAIAQPGVPGFRGLDAQDIAPLIQQMYGKRILETGLQSAIATARDRAQEAGIRAMGRSAALAKAYAQSELGRRMEGKAPKTKQAFEEEERAAAEMQGQQADAALRKRGLLA